MSQMLTRKERKRLQKEEKSKSVEKKDIKKFRSYAVWVVIIFVVIFGGFRLIKWINTPTSSETISDNLQLTSSDWVKGNDPDDDVTFVVIKVK